MKLKHRQKRQEKIWVYTQQTQFLTQKAKLENFLGAVATPHFFIIKNNQVLYEGAIDSIPNTESEDIQKATNYIEKALNEITSNKKVSIKKPKPMGAL